MSALPRLLVTTLALLCAASCGGKPGAPLADLPARPLGEQYAIDLASPDVVRKKGPYELKVYYIATGTRSRGLHGVLLKDGVAVDDASAGKQLQTTLGLVLCHGPRSERRVPFAKSGWLPSDLSGIYPSR